MTLTETLPSVTPTDAAPTPPIPAPVLRLVAFAVDVIRPALGRDAETAKADYLLRSGFWRVFSGGAIMWTRDATGSSAPYAFGAALKIQLREDAAAAGVVVPLD